MDKKIFSENIAIILVRPKYSSNIGSAARAMKNMGLTRMILISPKEFIPEEAKKLATHEASDIIDKMEVFDSLDLALNDFSYCIGTTARLGRNRNSIIETPESMAVNIASLYRKNRIAIIFGPENTGLQNEDLSHCHMLVNIPTDNFSSLNLSQAVMIAAYEIFKACNKTEERFTPRLASKFELDGMYDHMKDVLMKIDFIRKDNPDYWLNNIRQFLSRLPLRAKEVSIVRGILRQIEWYGKHMHEKGMGKKD